MNTENIKLTILVLISFTIVSFSYMIISKDNIISADEVVIEEVEEVKVNEEIDQSIVEEIIEDTTPESFTGLLVGFDVSGGLTDVLMLGHLDTETNEVKVISIPRDLVIDFRDEEFKHIKSNNPDNQVLYCKLNEVYSLTGWNDQALADVKEIISIITGLEIDYMAHIDVYGFSDLVDIVGGVEFYVPQDMDKDDPAQDLHIHLDEGWQLLDGDKAEQLVRYRSYVMGDLQRIQVQQDFMVALSDKIIQIRDFGMLTQLATSAYGMIDADFGLPLVVEYADYFYNLEMDELLNSDNMITIPSYGELEGGIWYQRWDKKLALAVVDQLINPVVEENLDEDSKENESNLGDN